MYSNKTQQSVITRLPYRQLQTYARVMRLPGNMKYDVLWELVKARKSGNERLVSQLLAEQKRIRLKRRIDKRIAKIKAETDERLMKETGTKIGPETENQRPRRVDMIPVLTDKPVLTRFAELFNSQRRYELKTKDYAAIRKARSLFATPPGLYNQQIAQYHPETQIDSSSALASYCDIIPPFNDLPRDQEVGHDFGDYLKMKIPEYRAPEPRKSFQIEDIIASAPTSTTFSSVYTNSYLTSYNHLVDCLPTVSHSKELSYCQSSDTLDPWRRNEDCDSPRPLSSNGSPSLFIDTSRLSPNNSDTMSANELCEMSRCSSIDAFIQTEDYSEPLPAFHSLNSNFQTHMENASVHREDLEIIEVDRDEEYLPIVKGISYPDVIPPHDSATVYFCSSDPLEVDDKSGASHDVENKIYTDLEGLPKSLNELNDKNENQTEFFDLKTNDDNIEIEGERTIEEPLSEETSNIT